MLVDKRPRYAVFSKDGARLWVSSEIGGSVAVIDPATRKIVKKIRFDIPGLTKQEIQPVGIRLTSDGKTAFVALGPANRVAVIDATDIRDREISAGRRAGLASRAHAGREVCFTRPMAIPTMCR